MRPVVDAACDVFLWYEVHAVAERGGDHDVCCSVECYEFVEADPLVRVAQDRAADPAVAGVDLAGETIHPFA